MEIHEALTALAKLIGERADIVRAEKYDATIATTLDIIAQEIHVTAFGILGRKQRES